MQPGPGHTNDFIHKRGGKRKEYSHGQNQIIELHDNPGGCLIATDAFDLSESNISNAIDTQSSCLKPINVQWHGPMLLHMFIMTTISLNYYFVENPVFHFAWTF